MRMFTRRVLHESRVGLRKSQLASGPCKQWDQLVSGEQAEPWPGSIPIGPSPPPGAPASPRNHAKVTALHSTWEMARGLLEQRALRTHVRVCAYTHMHVSSAVKERPQSTPFL